MKLFYGKDETHPIRELIDWEEHAPKKYLDHQDRSAYSLAHFFTDGINEENNSGYKLVQFILNQCNISATAEIKGYFEFPSKFDEFKNPRKNDLSLVIGKTYIAIEAKVDEPFGETIEIAINSAKKYKEEHPQSNRKTRIEQLINEYLKYNDYSTYKDLRYQLLFYFAAGIKINDFKNKNFPKLNYKFNTIILPIIAFNKTQNRYSKKKISRNFDDYQNFMAIKNFKEKASEFNLVCQDTAEKGIGHFVHYSMIINNLCIHTMYIQIID